MSFQQVSAPQPPPGRVDLDYVERMARQYVPEGWIQQNVPALVAELRAAREVVDAVEFWATGENVDQDVIEGRLLAARANYRKAVGS